MRELQENREKGKGVNRGCGIIGAHVRVHLTHRWTRTCYPVIPLQGLSSCKVKVWCIVGKHYKADCLVLNLQSGRVSVMVWGCFWQNKLGPLIALPKGSINSNTYCEILE